MPTLSQKALLVSLTVHQFTNRRTDKRIGAEVASSYNADTDAVSVGKTLLPPAVLKPITSHLSGLRATFNTMTLPWGEQTSSRIAPTKIFYDLEKTLIEGRDKLSNLVQTGLRPQLPQLLSDAPRRLGTMFDPATLPTPDAIVESFGVDWSFEPIAEAGDFRVDIREDEIAKLAGEYAQAAARREATATRELWTRAFQVVLHLSERLNAYTPGQEGERTQGIFHESTVENVKELAELLPRLNALDDPELDKLAADMAKLSRYDAKTLRVCDELRKDVMTDADDLIAIMRQKL